MVVIGVRVRMPVTVTVAVVMIVVIAVAMLVRVLVGALPAAMTVRVALRRNEHTHGHRLDTVDRQIIVGLPASAERTMPRSAGLRAKSPRSGGKRVYVLISCHSETRSPLSIGVY